MNEMLKNSIFTCIFFFLSTSVFAGDLVDYLWLKDNNSTSKIIDLRTEDLFTAGHIPHAINIPYSKFNREKNNIDGFIETSNSIKSLMESHGINNNDTLVLYSDWSFLDSMRIYWIMDFYGHKNIKVLDGGIQAWLSGGLELSLDDERIGISQYILEINSHIITTKFRTFMASKNPNYVIVDGRDNKEFIGKKSLTSRKGHIPNAINIPWVGLVDNRSEEQGYERIKAPATLKNLESLKEKLSIIPKDKKIILYCNGGQESSVLYFALKELGVNSSVYDGSWFEWSTDINMPIVSNTNNL